MGVSTLTREDVLSYREFDDAIARSAYPIDVHVNGNATRWVDLAPGRSYTIPYRCLVPIQMDGLLTAGRCLSADRDALGSVRVNAVSMATGEAAGSAAAIAAKQGCRPREVDTEHLRQYLRQRGAILE